MKVIQYIKVNHYMNRVAFASGVILTLLAIALHLPIISNGEQEAQATGSSDPSITMTFTNSTASVDLAVNSANGTFAESTDATSAKFSVSTTSAAGYTLSISASDDTGNLVNGSETLTSISSAISSATFDNASYNGKWGYKPSKLNSVANTNFQPSPTTEKTILDITESASTNNYTIALGTRADYLQSTGEYSKDLVIEAVSNFTPVTCDNTKLCVQYDGNGLTYEHGELVNNVNYNSTTTQQPITKYSHTSNIDNNGTATGTYPTGQATTDVVTIPGATELNITIYYATGLYGRYGVDATAYVFEGEYTGPISYDTTGYLKIYQDGDGTTKETANTESFTVSSDTVTFGFYSSVDDVTPAYGYYAIITGTGTVFDRTVASGEYTTPTGTNAIFYGWSSTQTTAGTGLPSQVEYTDESDVMSNIPGNEGESKTLYAVWQQEYPITFTKDSNVSSIAVLDSDDNTVGTITSSGQSLTLAGGDTYIIKPTHATGYTTNTIIKTSGAGTIGNYTYKMGGAQFTVGAGAATISVTSKVMYPMQNWTGCSSLAVGDTEQVYDARDNEVYLVGKLADSKCWMLDNLRLDLGNETVLNNTIASNTNASATALDKMKNGGGTTSDQYPTAKINNVAWTSSSQNYYSIPMTVSSGNGWDKDTTVTSYGSGSGKIGVYYNFCAASAGSYCYGNGTDYGTSSGNATEDICPAGWRMPTGGSSGEYQALYANYNTTQDATNTASLQYNLSTPLSGIFYRGSASHQGSDGRFWASTRFDDDDMDHLYVDSSLVYPRTTNTRYFGFSVRCLLR